MLKRITSWSFRHRRIVVVAWIAVLVAINLVAMAFGGENRQEFMSPGTDSKAAIDLLDERFPAQAGDTRTGPDGRLREIDRVVAGADGLAIVADWPTRPRGHV